MVSELGSRITREGLPIVAILAVGATAPQLGLLAALVSLAGIATAPLAGVLADRHRRRPVMIAADLLRALALVSVPAAALAHRLSFLQIACVMAVVGGLTVVFQVADQAWLPQFVSRRRLGEGNALVAGASAAGETGGPALMGALIQSIGGPLAIGCDAFSYVISAVSLLCIRQREAAPDAGGVQAPPALRQAVAGFRAVFAHPLLRPLALTVATQGLFGGFFEALYEIYALKTLHLSPAALGLLITAGGVGALAGSALAPAVGRRLGAGRSLALGTAVMGAFNFLVPWAHGSPVTAFLALFAAQLLGDLAGTVFEVHEATLRQGTTPDRWLGRVNATSRWLAAALGAAGALVAGGLAPGSGARAMLLVAAIGQTAAAGWIVFSPVRRLREPGPSRFGAPGAWRAAEPAS